MDHASATSIRMSVNGYKHIYIRTSPFTLLCDTKVVLIVNMWDLSDVNNAWQALERFFNVLVSTTCFHTVGLFPHKICFSPCDRNKTHATLVQSLLISEPGFSFKSISHWWFQVSLFSDTKPNENISATIEYQSKTWHTKHTMKPPKINTNTKRNHPIIVLLVHCCDTIICEAFRARSSLNRGQKAIEEEWIWLKIPVIFEHQNMSRGTRDAPLESLHRKLKILTAQWQMCLVPRGPKMPLKLKSWSEARLWKQTRWSF